MHKSRYRLTQIMIILAVLSCIARIYLLPSSSITVPNKYSNTFIVISTPIITENIIIQTSTIELSVTLTIEPSIEPSVTPTIEPSVTLTIEPSVTLTIEPVVKLLEPSGMFGAPSLWPEDIDAILKKRGSPAYGNGQVFWELGVAYKIDPAYFLAFFAKESSMGADPNWQQTNNPGNIICLSECTSRFQYYNSWAEGAEAWYSLISRKYAGQNVHQILSVYAPASDGNDPNAYADTVLQLVQQWRTR